MSHHADDLASVHSSELNESTLLQKRKNERFAMFLGIFIQIIWGFNNIQVKSFRPLFPNSYRIYTCIFWRILPALITAYIICKKNGHKITSFSEVKHKNWFLFRNVGLVLSIFFWIKSMEYFRISTITVIGKTSPLFIILISVVVLNETFYMRYLIGVVICFIGSAIIVLNDKKPGSKKNIINDNIFVGIILQILNVTFTSLNNVGQKILVKDKMDLNEQLFYLGLYNVVPMGIISLFKGDFIFDIKYILYLMSNGFFFYLGNYLTSMCFRYIAISKFQPITYLQIVFTFILSNIILGEPLYFTDIVGACFIIGFQFFNIKFPPGRKIDESKLKEKFKNDNDNNNKNEKE